MAALAKELERICDVAGTEELVASKEKLTHALELQLAAQRPLSTQLQELERKLDGQQKQATKLDADAKALKEKANALQTRAQEAKEAEAHSRKKCAALRAKQRIEKEAAQPNRAAAAESGIDPTEEAAAKAQNTLELLQCARETLAPAHKQ